MENGKDTLNKRVEAGFGGLFGLRRVGQSVGSGRCLIKVEGEQDSFLKIKIMNKMKE